MSWPPAWVGQNSVTGFRHESGFPRVKVRIAASRPAGEPGRAAALAAQRLGQFADLPPGRAGQLAKATYRVGTGREHGFVISSTAS